MIGRVPHDALWPVPRPIVGMIHLLPLPGSPRGGAPVAEVIGRALADAAALIAGGVHGLLVENYGDSPFYPAAVPVETVAAMAVVAREVVREANQMTVGVNVLRNDAAAALAVAAAAGCAFIRVNVHTGVMFADQGWLTGAAHETLRLRERLGARLAIFADVHVKHAVPPPGQELTVAARDTWERGLADALIVSGPATGMPTDADRLRTVRAAVPEAPLWIGSGITVENVGGLLGLADGAIVGSSLQVGGVAGGEVDVERVRALVMAALGAADPSIH